MRTRFSNLLAILALVLFLAATGSDASAQRPPEEKSNIPATVSYQGYVKYNGNPYNGTGYFKFALLDSSSSSHWSNDGSSIDGSQPTVSVALNVSGGLFNVLLGDTTLVGMSEPLTTDAFSASGITLRVWFSPDNLTFTQIAPDRALASVPFAFLAQHAADSDLLDGMDSSDFAAVSHDHDAEYAAANHNHDSAYAGIGHTHSDLYAAFVHSHPEYSLTTHNHDSAYADIGHAHSDLYAVIDHAHAEYSLTTHDHDSVYADIGHAHSDLYAVIDHAHAEYALTTHNHDGAYVNDNSYEVDNADIATGTISANRINGTAWTSTNDGTTTGLDADLLDGQEGSYYQRRVSGSCAIGSTIHTIAADGTVTCEPHITRPLYSDVTGPSSAWASGTNPAITIGLDGLPVIAFRDSATRVLKFTHCQDLNCISSTTRTLFTGNDTGFATQMTIGSDGYPVIVFADSGFATGNLYLLHCQDALCNTYNAQILGPDGVQRYGQSIAIGADDYPVVSYYDIGNQQLLVAHCDDVSCNTISTQTVDTNVGTNSSYTSIAIGMDGLPVISYYDPVATSLKVAHCGNGNCSSGVVIETVDGAGPENCGTYNQIAIGADGLPFIVFTRISTGQQLMFAHCGNTTCDSVLEENTLYNGDLSWPSLTIGDDGFPIITFYDWTNSDLEVVHCNSINCATTTSFTLAAKDINGGTSAITIGADGLPIISYSHEYPGYTLRVIHCANTFCTPNWSRR